VGFLYRRRGPPFSEKKPFGRGKAPRRPSSAMGVFSGKEKKRRGHGNGKRGKRMACPLFPPFTKGGAQVRGRGKGEKSGPAANGPGFLLKKKKGGSGRFLAGGGGGRGKKKKNNKSTGAQTPLRGQKDAMLCGTRKKKFLQVRSLPEEREEKRGKAPSRKKYAPQ